jgi:anti-sigma regulatory factor (Ser/Thr protein kinase)
MSMPYALESHSVPTTPASVSDARAWAASHLAAWDLAPLADDVTLVVSELVTNAIRAERAHGSEGRVGLVMELRGAALTVSVFDGQPYGDELAAGDPGADAESGRGLWLVGALTRKWGILPTGAGKAVWAALDAVGVVSAA